MFFNGLHVISFIALIAYKDANEKIDTFCQKRVTVDENMNVNIYINDNCRKYTEFGLSSDKIQSVKELKELIVVIDNRRLFQGCEDIKLTEQNVRLLKTFADVNTLNFVRSKHCPLFLPEDDKSKMSKKRNNQCLFCKNVKKILNKKIIRRQQNNTSRYVRIKNLSPTKRGQILRLKNSIKNIGRVKTGLKYVFVC